MLDQDTWVSPYRKYGLNQGTVSLRLQKVHAGPGHSGSQGIESLGWTRPQWVSGYRKYRLDQDTVGLRLQKVRAGPGHSGSEVRESMGLTRTQ